MTPILATPDTAHDLRDHTSQADGAAANPAENGGRSVPPVARGHGGSLTKITVNLIPRAYTALEQVSAATGDNKTESINRAIQLYAWVQRMLDAGESIHVVSKTGTVREVQIF